MTARILLADSNDRSREMLVKLLSIYGVTALAQVKDGLAAVSRLYSEVPELVIVDTDLQHLGGLSICEVLRFVPRFRDVKVVLLGSGISSALMKQGMQLGIHAFLERPVNAENVKSIVELLKAEGGFSRSDLPSSINKILSALSNSAQKNLTLLFKSQARILKIETLTPEYAEKQWDIISKVELRGQVGIQVATAATLASAKALGEVMPNANGAQRESVVAGFLDDVVERALPDIRKVFAIQSEARSRSTGMVPLDKEAQYQFAVHLRVGFDSAILRKQLAIPLYVTVTLA